MYDKARSVALSKSRKKPRLGLLTAQLLLLSFLVSVGWCAVCTNGDQPDEWFVITENSTPGDPKIVYVGDGG
mgnify:CR=1 FL=1